MLTLVNIDLEWLEMCSRSYDRPVMWHPSTAHLCDPQSVQQVSQHVPNMATKIQNMSQSDDDII